MSVDASPFMTGGRTVPVAAHRPQPTASPSPMPRYLTINPHVRPPMPQIAPKATHLSRVEAGAEPITPQKSGTAIAQITAGITRSPTTQ